MFGSYMGGLWGCSSMFMGPMMFSPMSMYGGFAGSMIGGGLGGALGYFAAGGMNNPWAGMTGMFVGNMLGSSLGWLAGSFGF
ncbi:hypothetical protein DYH09_09345 [bacterium CPR1]|nr:hypothetical protein [bacterium CPR1]